MGLKEDIINIQREVSEVKEQSLAMEMYRDSKNANKRMAIAFTIVGILILILWGVTIAYLIKTLNDIEVTTTTTETNEQNISDIDTMDNNQIINGDYNEYIKPKD